MSHSQDYHFSSSSSSSSSSLLSASTPNLSNRSFSPLLKSSTASSTSFLSSSLYSLTSSLTRRTLAPHTSLSETDSSSNIHHLPVMLGVSNLSSKPTVDLTLPLLLEHSQYLLSRANYLYLFISFSYLTINLIRSYSPTAYESTYLMLLVDTIICACNSLLLFDAILYWCSYAELQYVTWEKRKRKERNQLQAKELSKKLLTHEKILEQQSPLLQHNQTNTASNISTEQVNEAEETYGIEEEEESNDDYHEDNEDDIEEDQADTMKISDVDKAPEYDEYEELNKHNPKTEKSLPPRNLLSIQFHSTFPPLLALSYPPPLYTVFLQTITSWPYLFTLSGQVEFFNILPSLFYTFSSLFPLLTSPLLVGYELTAGVESKIEELVWGLDVAAMAMFIIDAILCWIQWKKSRKRVKEKEDKISVRQQLRNKNIYPTDQENLGYEMDDCKNPSNDTNLNINSSHLASSISSTSSAFSFFFSFFYFSFLFDYLFYSNIFNISASLSYFSAVLIGFFTRINVAAENSLTWSSYPPLNMTNPTHLSILSSYHHDNSLSGELSLWHQLLISSDNSAKLLMCIGDFLYLLCAISLTLSFRDEELKENRTKSLYRMFRQQDRSNKHNGNNNIPRKHSIGRGKHVAIPLENDVATV